MINAKATGMLAYMSITPAPRAAQPAIAAYYDRRTQRYERVAPYDVRVVTKTPRCTVTTFRI